MNLATHAPIAAPRAARASAWAAMAIGASATAWFTVAVLGQLMLAAYVIGFYGRAVLDGQPERWNQVLPHGHVPGDVVGNLVVGAHLGFTVIAVLGGALQLVPMVRRRWPAFHRWTGRVYLAVVALLSLSGLAMVATRGAVGATSQTVAISMNAVMILVFAALALHHARHRRIDRHRRWALRLFLAVSGVWFFRVGLMFWILVNQAPVGFDPETFRGPALTTIAFAQTLLPLAVLELYFRAQRSPALLPRFAMAATLGLLTLLTVVGIFGAVVMLWLPHL